MRKLTEMQVVAVVNALRAAVDIYKADAVTCRKAGDERTSDAFIRQAITAEQLAEEFDGAVVSLGY